jgi:hypothetical protein
MNQSRHCESNAPEAEHRRGANGGSCPNFEPSPIAARVAELREGLDHAWEAFRVFDTLARINRTTLPSLTTWSRKPSHLGSCKQSSLLGLGARLRSGNGGGRRRDDARAQIWGKRAKHQRARRTDRALHQRICARESRYIYPYSPRRAGFMLKLRIGGENDQVDRCCLCLGRRNICAGHVTGAGSSAGQHDNAGPRRMRRGYAHD